MTARARLAWQPSLLDSAGPPSFDHAFTNLVRHDLDATAWVDVVAGWVRGADALFDDLIATAPWLETKQEIYGRVVATPRLVARWDVENPAPALLEEIRAALVDHYGRPFDSVSANLYRDGRDGVAWHGDRIPPTVADPLVAVVSLGSRRRLLLRPRGGGPTALRLEPAPGDLVVMGGSSQRTWQHSVPKATTAGPRISVTIRHSR